MPVYTDKNEDACTTGDGVFSIPKERITTYKGFQTAALSALATPRVRQVKQVWVF
jgi:hypothetical protein